AYRATLHRTARRDRNKCEPTGGHRGRGGRPPVWGIRASTSRGGAPAQGGGRASGLLRERWRARNGPPEQGSSARGRGHAGSVRARSRTTEPFWHRRVVLLGAFQSLLPKPKGDT